jgi:hypothetical protein
VKRERARDELKEILEGDRIDLIIIDHVLLGFTLDSTMNPDGIELINELWKISDRIKRIPVIFLSSAHPNDMTVLKRLQVIDNDDTIKIKPEWLYKKPHTTSGPIGDRSYFRQFVIPKIKKLVEKAGLLTKGEELAGKLTLLGEQIFGQYDVTQELHLKKNKYYEIIDRCKGCQDGSFLAEVTQLITKLEEMLIKFDANNITFADFCGGIYTLLDNFRVPEIAIT